VRRPGASPRARMTRTAAVGRWRSTDSAGVQHYSPLNLSVPTIDASSGRSCSRCTCSTPARGRPLRTAEPIRASPTRVSKRKPQTDRPCGLRRDPRSPGQAAPRSALPAPGVSRSWLARSACISAGVPPQTPRVADLVVAVIEATPGGSGQSGRGRDRWARPSRGSQRNRGPAGRRPPLLALLVWRL
jgi:hypothetical protein